MMEHFKHVGSIPVSALQAACRRHAGEFGRVTWREKTPGSPHPDTETLYLRMPREITRETVFHSLDCADTPLMADPAFDNATLRLSLMTGARLARCMVVKLNPGGKIAPHTDKGAYAEATHRWHVPIETNDKAWLQSGNERCWMMEPGTVYWFDKHAEHFGANEGETPRIHLIVDTWR